MSKHEGNTAVVEQPKVKTGDKAPVAEVAKTVVDAPAKEKGPRAPRAPKTTTYRILDGVDASKFAGQRGHVIKALQKLSSQHGPDKHFTVKEIADATEGNLVSKTPVEDSVNYHLKGLAKDGQVASHTPVPPAKEETKAA